MIGQTFGRWEVVGRAPVTSGSGKIYWVCRCQCGVVGHVTTQSLRSGDSSSCGCRKREVTGARRRTHGQSGTPEYKAWKQLRSRCLNRNNKSWKNYGGRGITVHASWLNDFAAFLRDVGLRPSPQHSIDRIDNDGNYEPGNVRWTVRARQTRNRQITVMVDYGGSRISLGDVCELAGIDYHAAYDLIVRDRIQTARAVRLLRKRAS